MRVTTYASESPLTETTAKPGSGASTPVRLRVFPI
jgi:hypothetical protein